MMWRGTAQSLSYSPIYHYYGRSTIIMKRLFTLSLRRKIILACLICLIIPGYTAFLAVSYSTKDILVEQAIKEQKKSLELSDTYISNLLKRMIYICNYIQFDSDFIRILKMNGEANLDQSDEVMSQNIISDKLNNLTYSGERTYITILLPNGKSFTNYPYSEFNPIKFEETSWFSHLTNMRAFDVYWVGSIPTYLESEKQRNPYVLTLGKTLRTPSGKTYAYVIASIYENEINGAFPSDGLEEETMLIDEDGMIISSHNADQIGRQLAYADRIPHQADPVLITIEGQRRLLFTQPLSIGKWKLLLNTPYDAVVGKVNAIYAANFAIQGAMFCVLIVILVYLLRQFTAPIIKLERVATLVESGDLSVRSNIRGKDEVGKLGKSFDHMIDQVELMIERITLEQTQKRKAEIAMLQAQINPHFLFNTLNSIRLRVLMKGDEENADIIASLSSLLRMTINRNNSMIPLIEEIEMVMNYVDLLNYRHKDNMTVDVDASRDTLTMEVPRFFLQPLIENAYIHGFQQRAGEISLRSWVEGQLMCVAVHDKGIGMSSEQLERLRLSLTVEEIHDGNKEMAASSFSGIGLRNVYTRMRMIYGPRFELRIESEPGQGTFILFLIPIQAGEQTTC